MAAIALPGALGGVWHRARGSAQELDGLSAFAIARYIEGCLAPLVALLSRGAKVQEASYGVCRVRRTRHVQRRFAVRGAGGQVSTPAGQ